MENEEIAEEVKMNKTSFKYTWSKKSLLETMPSLRASKGNLWTEKTEKNGEVLKK